MSEQENIDFVRGMFEDWNARRPIGMETIDPEVQWDSRNIPVPEIQGVYRGHEGVRRFWGEWLPAWERVTVGIHWIRAAGDRVVVWITQQMIGKESGLEFEMTYGWDIIVRDRQYTRVAFITEEDEALAAVGAARR